MLTISTERKNNFYRILINTVVNGVFTILCFLVLIFINEEQFCFNGSMFIIFLFLLLLFIIEDIQRKRTIFLRFDFEKKVLLFAQKSVFGSLKEKEISFTDLVIESERKNRIFFILWGNPFRLHFYRKGNTIIYFSASKEWDGFSEKNLQLILQLLKENGALIK